MSETRRYVNKIEEKTYINIGIQTEKDQIADVAMWHIIETGMGLKISIYLKNILRLEGYDIPIVIYTEDINRKY